MIGNTPSHTIAKSGCVLLVLLTVTAAPATAGILDKAKSVNDYAKGILSNPRVVTASWASAVGNYTKGIQEEGMGLIQEGLSGMVDAETYNRRTDAFLDRKAQMGVKTFIKDAADHIKLKVANPLEGLKDTLGDTRLGRAAASVKEKLWATTSADAGTDVATPAEPYGAVDPCLALDVQEEETAWYQAETGIMDETPLPQAEVIAHVNDNPGGSPDSGVYTYDAAGGQPDYAQRGCENNWAGCADPSNQERQAHVQERNPWSDIDDGVDEWGDSATPDCRGPWVDIDCGNEYQGDENWSEETDTGTSDDPEGEPYGEGATYADALDGLLDEETTSDSDEYSPSGEGYEEALDHLEAAERERLAAEQERERLAAERKRLAAEAAERERLARLETEMAEREYQARLEAEIAEQEYQAEREAQAAEREMYGALSGGILKGLENAGVLESGTSGLIGDLAGLGSSRGFASGLNQSLGALSSGTPNNAIGGLNSTRGGGGAYSCPGQSRIMAQLEQIGTQGSICGNAREVKRVYPEVLTFYQSCPSADPTGEMAQHIRDTITWANETERQACAVP